MLAVLAFCGFLLLAVALVIIISENQAPGAPAAPGTGSDAVWGGGGGGGGGGTGSGRAGRLLATLERGPMTATLQPGSGAGVGIPRFSKTYTRPPFPVRGGVVVTFELYFQPGFEWSCRGKIGGVYVGTGTASGGNYSTNGASHRLMWGADGNAFSYVYVPSGTQSRQPPPLNTVRQYGQGVFESDFKRALATNGWNRIELGVKLNTVGRADGQLLLGVNGKVRVLSGVIWRLSNLDIRTFHINVFHGGGCTATRTSKVSFRNIEAREWA